MRCRPSARAAAATLPPLARRAASMRARHSSSTTCGIRLRRLVGHRRRAGRDAGEDAAGRWRRDDARGHAARRRAARCAAAAQLGEQLAHVARPRAQRGTARRARRARASGSARAAPRRPARRSPRAVAQRRQRDRRPRRRGSRDPRAARPTRRARADPCWSRSRSGSRPCAVARRRAAHLARLEHAQQLGLHLRVELGDLVEEQRAAVGFAASSRRRLLGARVRAALGAEQQTLGERCGIGGAVDRRRTARSRARRRGGTLARCPPCRCRSRRACAAIRADARRCATSASNVASRDRARSRRACARRTGERPQVGGTERTANRRGAARDGGPRPVCRRRSLAIDERAVLAAEVGGCEATLTVGDARVTPRDSGRHRPCPDRRSRGRARAPSSRRVGTLRDRRTVGEYQNQPRPSIRSTWHSERARWEGCWIHDRENIAD